MPLDNPCVKQFEQVFKMLSEGRPERKMIELSPLQYAYEFKKVAQSLKIEAAASITRGSGARVDRAIRLRGRPQIQNHGRWEAPRSVDRYEKQSMSNRVWTCLTERQQRFFEAFKENVWGAIVFDKFPEGFDQAIGSP